MLKLAIVATAAFSLSACGSDDGEGQADAAVDAGPTIDAPPLACMNRSVAEQLGTISGAPFSAIADNRGMVGGPITLRITALIDRSAPPNPKDDIFSIRLFQGVTVFDPDLVTGTFPLTGVESSFYSCGACVHLLGDYDPGVDEVAQNFIVDSGMLTISAISTEAGQMVTGSITDAHFREVTLDDGNMLQTVIPGGCEATLDEITFNASVQVP